MVTIRVARRTATAWAAAALAVAAPAEAEVVRFVDEAGAIHLTNTPCHPTYVRLDPRACPALAAEVPTEATPPTDLGGEIERTATRYGVDRRLVQAVVQVESGGDPGAVSPKGALGLMQLMPARAAALGVVDAFDALANLDGGVRHLRDLLVRYAGDVRLALAAYNAGEDAVRIHGGVPPYPETQAYVRKVLSHYDFGGGLRRSSSQPARLAPTHGLRPWVPALDPRRPLATALPAGHRARGKATESGRGRSPSGERIGPASPPARPF